MKQQFDSASQAVRRALLLAPLIFICHVLEEAPSFVSWVNARVESGITAQMFWSVNLFGLIITLIVIGLAWLRPSPASFLLAAAWLSFLMLANAVLHLAATIMFRSYAPGVVTAGLLYIPYSLWLMRKIFRAHLVKRPAIFAAMMIGASPMLLHGYLIVFRGSGLF